MIELHHAVVEFMIARNDQVISGFVHDVNDCLPLRQRAHDFALHGIARVNERDVFGAEHAFAIGNITSKRRVSQRYAAVGGFFAHGAMHVVGVQNDDGPVGCRCVVGKRTLR